MGPSHCVYERSHNFGGITPPEAGVHGHHLSCISTRFAKLVDTEATVVLQGIVDADTPKNENATDRSYTNAGRLL